MDDIRTYQIRILGQVAEGDIASFSPPEIRLEPVNETSTLLAVRTDQSGLIGLLRQLHGLGLVLLSFEVLPQA